MVLFVAWLRCPRSLTFSTLFFEASGGNPQHYFRPSAFRTHLQLAVECLEIVTSFCKFQQKPFCSVILMSRKNSFISQGSVTSWYLLPGNPAAAWTHRHPTHWLIIWLLPFSFRQAIQNLNPILNICIFPILLVQIVFVCEI